MKIHPGLNFYLSREHSDLQLHEGCFQPVTDLPEVPHVVPHLIHVHHLLLLEGLYVLVQCQQPLLKVHHPERRIHR